jgi:hypothetical protein
MATTKVATQCPPVIIVKTDSRKAERWEAKGVSQGDGKEANCLEEATEEKQLGTYSVATTF